MKKIIVALMLCAMSFGTLTTSTASAKDRLKLSDARESISNARDLVQLGIAGVKGAKKVGNGLRTASDAIGTVQDKISSVKNIGKVFRRR
jgi:hypothetical protein